MSRLTSKLMAAGAALLLIPALTACGNPLEGLIQGAVEGAVKDTAGGLLEKATGGEVGGMFSTEVPDDFPDIPRPDQDPVQALRLAGDGDVTWTLHYVVPNTDEIERIARELIARGYTEETNSQMGGMFVSSYRGPDYFVMLNSLGDSDGDGYTLQLMVTAETGQ